MTNIIQYISSDYSLVKWLKFAYTLRTGQHPESVKQVITGLRYLGYSDNAILDCVEHATYPRDCITVSNGFYVG